MTPEDMTPEEIAEMEAEMEARRAEALSAQMADDARYDVPPWSLPEPR